MKTLVLEADPRKARIWADRYDTSKHRCDTARSPAQARLMLIAGGYERFCLRLGAQAGASRSLLSVARAMNPDCEIVDLARKTRRPVNGPVIWARERQPAPMGVLRRDALVDTVSS